jgi:PKD repeat protein
VVRITLCVVSNQHKEKRKMVYKNSRNKLRHISQNIIVCIALLFAHIAYGDDHKGDDRKGDDHRDKNRSPKAQANGPYTGFVGDSVNFSSKGSKDEDGRITRYKWDFGDGSSSRDANPVHRYTSAGKYTATLTVTDNDKKSDRDKASVKITQSTDTNNDPVADANGPYSGVTGIAILFSSSGSSDSDGTITSYSWDFGDGSNSNEQNPNHSYNSAGNYTVTLTVTDDDGAQNTDTSSASISNPDTGNQAPSANVNGPYSGITGTAINFSSAGSSDSDGTIASYSWSFGDGNSSSSANPTHSYSVAGSYTVSLIVTDNDGASSTASTTTATISDPANNAPPVANANGPYSGTIGTAISFSSAGSSDSDGTIASYSWSFGDGNTSTTANPTHSYTSAGRYTVSLTVTDNDGASSTPASSTANIVDASSSVTAQANGPYYGSTAAAVSFTSAGSSSNSAAIVSYHWDFGDGNSSTEPSPMHTYASVNSYNVTLTVTDGSGNSASDTSNAIIQAVSAESINSTSQAGSISSSSVAQQSLSGNTSYRLFGTNDLGMHCGDFDTRISSILPPFNVLHAQVIQMGSSPSILSGNDGISVYYSAATNSNDPILSGVNSSGDGDILSSIANNGQVFKTNFWDTASTNAVEPTALSAYRAFYPPGILDAFYPNGGRDTNNDINIKDLGLPMPDNERLYLGDGLLTATQQSMSGRLDPYAVNTPQKFSIFAVDQPFFINFAFGYTSQDVNWFEAAGIPLTAFDDSGRENPWPLYRFQAKNTSTGTVLASTDVVVPISGEANCGFCHNASIDGGNGSASKQLEDNGIEVATVLDDPLFDVSVPLAVSKEYAADLNILRLHDLKHGTELEANTPVVCQSCHYTPALDLAQVGPKGPENDAANANGRDQAKNKSMSNVMHSHHASVRDLNGKLMFPQMPPAVDTNGNARDAGLTKTRLNETCYQCHPGRRTDCLRGAMANGGMVCQDCHGQLEQVGNDFSRSVGPDSVGSFELANDFYDHTSPTPRVPWANEPGCGSCHTGDAQDNLYSDSTTLGSPNSSDNIRLVQAFRVGDNKATPIVPSNKRFAENTVASTGNPMLYRVSKGHGGVFCEACHGATHGIWPNKNPSSNDNVTAIQLQGHTGPVIECSTCHGNTNLGNTLDGPHGMHAVGETKFADGGHENLAETSSGKNACRSCHGINGEGTVLSRTAQARDFRGMKNGKQVAKGHQVTCTDCHSNKL